MDTEEGLYARALDKVKTDVLSAMRGKDFTTKDVWELLGVQNRPEHAPYKRAISDVLYNVTNVNKKPLLKQIGNRYRIIDRGFKEIEWWIPDGRTPLSLKWPRGINDGSSFGFEDSATIYPGDSIVVAGEGNEGKTGLLLNMMFENMDNYNCTYITSEFNSLKFSDRVDSVDWIDLYKDGRPKFELLPKPDNFEDIVMERPNNIVFIDWVRMDDEAWKVRALLDRIMKPLDEGIVIIAMQKRSYKDVGEGGEGGMDLASVYLTLSYQKIYVKKVKTWNMYDPNRKHFGFELGGKGLRFSHIREIVKCSKCKGRGTNFGNDCIECYAVGYVDK